MEAVPCLVLLCGGGGRRGRGEFLFSRQKERRKRKKRRLSFEIFRGSHLRPIRDRSSLISVFFYREKHISTSMRVSEGDTLGKTAPLEAPIAKGKVFGIATATTTKANERLEQNSFRSSKRTAREFWFSSTT